MRLELCDRSPVYSEAAAFSIQSVRELAEAVNDTAGPVVTNFYQWGPWVNGGAWLTIGGPPLAFPYPHPQPLARGTPAAQARPDEPPHPHPPPPPLFTRHY